MTYSLFSDIGAKLSNMGSYYWGGNMNPNPYKDMKLDTSNKYDEDSKIRVSSGNVVNLKVDFFNKNINQEKH